jgi:AraC-like DNA-binding protein
MEGISAAIVTSTEHYRISKVLVRREPMLGALVTAGPWRQTRFIEEGGLVVGTPAGVRVLGPGHSVDLAGGERFLYLPLAGRGPLVEWVLAVEEGAREDELPEVRTKTPAADPLALPMSTVNHLGLYPDWAVPWLGVPADVATWAGALGVHGTSLAQRTQRLVGESPKRILSAARATVAFELAAFYRGKGAALAIDTGYASQSHLSRDLRDRFGIPLTKLFADGAVAELSWLHLVKSVVR